MNDDLLDALDDLGADTELAIMKTFMNDEEMYLGYVYQFPNNRNIVALRKAVDENTDKPLIAREVHTLKGVVQTLGFNSLYQVCEKMNIPCKQGDFSGIKQQLPPIEAEFQKYVEIIKKYTPEDYVPPVEDEE